jgi:hypothetical protein
LGWNEAGVGQAEALMYDIACIIALKRIVTISAVSHKFTNKYLTENPAWH